MSKSDEWAPENAFSKKSIIKTILDYINDNPSINNESLDDIIHDAANCYIAYESSAIDALNNYQSDCSDYPGVYGALEDITNYYANYYDQNVPTDFPDPVTIANQLALILMDYWRNEISSHMKNTMTFEDAFTPKQVKEFAQTANKIINNEYEKFDSKKEVLN